MIIHDFNLSDVNSKEAEKRNVELEAGRWRANAYKRQLDHWRRLNSIIHSPYFNATKESRIYVAHRDLGDWLKKEAECLWDVGINVY